MHFDKKEKDILIPGEGPTQWLDDTTLTAQVKYGINFTQSRKHMYQVYTIMETTAIC